MFSVLGFAYMIRGKLGQKIEFKIFLFIIIGISVAILYQFTLSTQKLQSNLTGTKVEYIETDPNLNIYQYQSVTTIRVTGLQKKLQNLKM